MLISLALIFNFLNGFHDSSNIVATVISSRAMSPNRILWVTAIAEFMGPFLFGVAVAQTIGTDVVQAETVTPLVIAAALISAIIWNVVTWFLGIPSSSSHALIGGIIGAATMFAGPGVVKFAGLTKILIVLFTSPIIGLFVGFFLSKLVFILSQNATPSINWFFKRAQLITALALALSHGANDAQKTMGIITLALLTSGQISEFQVPLWVIVICGAVMALGTVSGGWRLIRTLGGKFYKIRPVHGFTSQFASAAVILGAAVMGGPVSTTQVVSSVIMGVGSAERVSKVRWNVAGEIVTAWVLTIPATALLAMLVGVGLARLFPGG